MNPLRQLRSDLFMTQEEVADLAGITSQSILRYEQGLYEKPSLKLIQTLLSLGSPSNVTIQSVTKDYSKWRTAHQRLASVYFTPVGTLYRLRIIESDWFSVGGGATQNPIIQRFEPLESPFETWRTGILDNPSRMNFCILLAIHPSVVASYEKGRRRGMPPLIRIALVHAGVSLEVLDRLEALGEHYYDLINSDHKSKR